MHSSLTQLCRLLNLLGCHHCLLRLIYLSILLLWMLMSLGCGRLLCEWRGLGVMRGEFIQMWRVYRGPKILRNGIGFLLCLVERCICFRIPLRLCSMALIQNAILLQNIICWRCELHMNLIWILHEGYCSPSMRELL